MTSTNTLVIAGYKQLEWTLDISALSGPISCFAGRRLLQTSYEILIIFFWLAAP